MRFYHKKGHESYNESEKKERCKREKEIDTDNSEIQKRHLPYEIFFQKKYHNGVDRDDDGEIDDADADAFAKLEGEIADRTGDKLVELSVFDIFRDSFLAVGGDDTVKKSGEYVVGHHHIQ